jgi:hypothetical protein
MTRIAIDPTLAATLPLAAGASAAGCLKTMPHYTRLQVEARRTLTRGGAASRIPRVGTRHKSDLRRSSAPHGSTDLPDFSRQERCEN